MLARLLSTVMLVLCAACNRFPGPDSGNCDTCEFAPANVASAEVREAAFTQLVAEQRKWIANNADFPVAYDPDHKSRIYFVPLAVLQQYVDPMIANSIQGRYHGKTYGRPFTYILLREEWAFNAKDMSFLLHELIHEMQDQAGVLKGCPVEFEMQAYRLQQKWAAEHGYEMSILFKPLELHAIHKC